MILEIAFTGVTFFFLVYLLFFFVAANVSSRNQYSLNKEKSLKKINIIIPVFNEEKVIQKCIHSILSQKGDLVNKIIIVLDNCEDKTCEICKALVQHSKGKIEFLSRNHGKPSKVKSVFEALHIVSDEFFAIIDADTVLADTALLEVYRALVNSEADFATCLIDPYIKKGFLYQIISWDRIFRQRIVQMGKNTFDMANFPGCFGVMKTTKFKELLEDTLLEDYLLTLKAIMDNSSITLVPKILAYEQEKSTIKTLFFQRVRWTIGNIIIFKSFIQALRKVKPIKKFVLLSYPLLWYYLYYLLFLLLLMLFVIPSRLFFYNYLFLGGLFFLMLILIKVKFLDLHLKDFVTLPLFILFFPFVMTFSFVVAVFILCRDCSVGIKLNKKYFGR